MTFVAPAVRLSVDAPRPRCVASSRLESETSRAGRGATRQRAFTLVELLLVLAIGGIIIAIAMPLFERYIEKSRVITAVVEIGEMSKAIRTYEKANGALPASLTIAGYPNKLDPWGYAYQYIDLRSLNGNGTARKDKKLAPLNSDFDLYSVGKDGETAASLGNSKSRDDIVRARDGGFIGLAEEFDP